MGFDREQKKWRWNFLFVFSGDSFINWMLPNKIQERRN
jgi:hypothetical protein